MWQAFHGIIDEFLPYKKLILTSMDHFEATTSYFYNLMKYLNFREISMCLAYTIYELTIKYIRNDPGMEGRDFHNTANLGVPDVVEKKNFHCFGKVSLASLEQF